MISVVRVVTRSHRRAIALSSAIFILATSIGGAAALVRIAGNAYVRGELQVEADREALAVAEAIAHQNSRLLGRIDASAVAGDVRLGQWDSARREFLPARRGANAVEIVTEGVVQRTPGKWWTSLFLPEGTIARTKSVAAIRPRDIVFVVELSAAMTWETRAALEHLFYSTVEDPAYLEDRALHGLYADLGYGEFPGTLEPFGAPWHVGEGRESFHAMISVDGPLSHMATDPAYRIEPQDRVALRRDKVFRAVIDRQIVRLVPDAKPDPSCPDNFLYWAAYLEDLLASKDSRARIGYPSYIRFMLAHGRNLRAGGRHITLSQYSEDCPWHVEPTGTTALRFPVRTQPMHDVRKGLTAVLQHLGARNRSIQKQAGRDRVAVLTFDSLSSGGPWIEQPLSDAYGETLLRCSMLQAVGTRADRETCLPALRLAEGLLADAARDASTRNAVQVVVLVTAGNRLDAQPLLEQVDVMRRRGMLVRAVSVGPHIQSAASPGAESDSQRPEAGVATGRRCGIGQVLEDAIAAPSIALVQ